MDTISCPNGHEHDCGGCDDYLLEFERIHHCSTCDIDFEFGALEY